MTPSGFLTTVLVPGLTWLSSVLGPKPPASREARLLLLAIPGIESGYENIRQEDNGPAVGYFQDESETCSEVIANPAANLKMHLVCADLKIPPNGMAIYGSLLGSPDLQVAMSRMVLWCDPYPLPAYGDEGAAWHRYVSVWRPGKPRQRDWPPVYAAALAADRAYEAAQVKA